MLIAITGKAGSGKDTAGDYLCRNHNFTKVALADPIKRLVKDVFVLSDKEVYDRIEREKLLPEWSNWSVRTLLQKIGTELFRDNIEEDIWVKSLYLRIKNDLNIGFPYEKNFVITDLRFPNELEYLQTRLPCKKFNESEYKPQFESWKIVRTGCNGAIGLANHRSEAYDLKTDFIIENNGTLEDLYNQIDNCVHGG